jgi:hypothetical protein
MRLTLTRRARRCLAVALSVLATSVVLVVTPAPAYAGVYQSCGATWCQRWWTNASGTDTTASAYIEVIGHRKFMRICQEENRGLAIEIDPSGAAAPLRYRYSGLPAEGACATYDIWYSVRKLRFVSVNNITGGVDGVRPWQMEPLPRPDW